MGDTAPGLPELILWLERSTENELNKIGSYKQKYLSEKKGWGKEERPPEEGHIGMERSWVVKIWRGRGET